jgi:hypothetical protein
MLALNHSTKLIYQMNTNAGKANSLINYVQFWIEMLKKDFVTLPLTFSPQIRYESTIYIPWLWSSWLSDCKYVCVCMWKAHVREHQRGNNKMVNP